MFFPERVTTVDKVNMVIVSEVADSAIDYLEKTFKEMRGRSIPHNKTVTDYLLLRVKSFKEAAVYCKTLEQTQVALLAIGTILMEFPPGKDRNYVFCEHPDTKEIGFWYSPDATFRNQGIPLMNKDVMSLVEGAEEPDDDGEF